MVLKFINKGFLTSNMLKIIAMVTMLIDHVGLELCGNSRPMRIIGRIAMPIFAYLIAEGCRYTKNRLRHFLEVFGLGVFCQVCYVAVGGDLHLNILLTFSVSIGLIYVTDFAMKNKWFIPTPIILLGLLYIASGKYFPAMGIRFDYGFWGTILPVFAFVFKNKWLKFISFTVGLLLLCRVSGSVPIYSLFALIPIFFYNGERGKFKFKYAFYLFYPLHLFAIFVVQNVIEALT